MSKKFIISIVTLLAIAVVAAIVIFLAKGYTFSSKEKRIVGTGIITISSEPDAASVFIDGHLTTATNTTIASLPPKNYKVRVVKEGFIPWEKEITVKEGLVTEVKATLFPAIPTIYPLTFSGVKSPVLSPDGSKLAFIVPASPAFGSPRSGGAGVASPTQLASRSERGEPASSSAGGANKKSGIWVWTQTRNQPISFVRSSEPHQITQSTIIDFSDAKLKWSSDSKQVLAEVSGNNYLLEADKLNTDPLDITPVLQATVESWEEDARSKDESRVEAIKDIKLRQVASDSALLHWSPDETKFMARKEPILDKDSGKVTSDLKVYDLEDKKEYSLPPARSHIWLPDSRHIILIEEGIISIVDFDGTNKAVIYAGNFEDDFVFPWPDSSRLVIISSFPTPTASEPNLYGINLK